MKKVNILGTTYTVKKVKISENEELRDNSWAGVCGSLRKEILIGDASETEYFGKLSKAEQKASENETLRHEITHAFLKESGLWDDAKGDQHWATNEEMVDWIAQQFPKMQKAFDEVGCI